MARVVARSKSPVYPLPIIKFHYLSIALSNKAMNLTGFSAGQFW